MNLTKSLELTKKKIHFICLCRVFLLSGGCHELNFKGINFIKKLTTIEQLKYIETRLQSNLYTTRNRRKPFL